MQNRTATKLNNLKKTPVIKRYNNIFSNINFIVSEKLALTCYCYCIIRLPLVPCTHFAERARPPILSNADFFHRIQNILLHMELSCSHTVRIGKSQTRKKYIKAVKIYCYLVNGVYFISVFHL